MKKDKRLAGLLGAIALTGVGCSTMSAAPGVDYSAAVADAGRPEADRARDADRRPAEVLAFARIRPGDRIAELAPGGGYFTRLLSRAVGPSGRVYAMSSRPSPAMQELAKTYTNVAFIQIEPGMVTPPEPVDVVWTTQNYHDFKNAKAGAKDLAVATNESAFRALKPGGIYLVGDHETAPGAGASQTSTLHRIEGAFVRQEVEQAGFKLEESSDLLRHPGDDHTLRVQESGIRGKTDQFLMRFRKPRR